MPIYQAPHFLAGSELAEYHINQAANEIIKDSVGLGIGQSLMRGLTYSQESNSDIGAATLLATLSDLLPDREHHFINSAVGGTYAVNTSDTSSTGKYWWDISSNTPNYLATDAVNDAISSGKEITYIIDGQGEADSSRIPNITTREDFKSAKLALYSWLRDQLGNVPVFIQMNPGRRTTSSTTQDNGASIIRAIYKELIAENDFIHAAGEIYDLGLYDHVHLSDAGYQEAGRRNALAIASQSYGINTPWHGGKIINIDLQNISSGSVLTRLWAEVEHESGADWSGWTGSSLSLNPSSGKKSQFKIFVDGVETIPNKAVIFASSSSSRNKQIRLDFAENFNSANAIEFYNFHSTGVDTDLGKIAYDTNNLPIRTAHWKTNNNSWEEV